MIQPAVWALSLIFAAGLGVLSAHLLSTKEDVSDLETHQLADPSAVRAFARANAAEMLAARNAEAASKKIEFDENAEKELAAAAVSRQAEIDALTLEIERLQKAVALAESIAQKPFNRAEYDVQVVTKELIEPLARGKIFLTSGDAAIRLSGVRSIVAAARQGKAEAFTILNTLLLDGDTEVAKEAARSIRRLSEDGDATRIAALAAAGVERTIADLIGTQTGREQRQSLEILTDLKSAQATPMWREIFTRPQENNRGNQDRLTAANRLRKLGSTAESNQMLIEATTDLSSSDRPTARRALQTLTDLEDPQAKTALEAALASQPEGGMQRQIKSALQQIEWRETGFFGGGLGGFAGGGEGRPQRGR